MKDNLGWGILATGWIAELFTRDLLLCGYPVVAVGSRSEEKAREFAGRLGISKAHGSYQELVSNPDVDIVYVATPHPFHAECAMLALKAGKHVLIEKPFTLNAKEARAVVDFAESQGLVVMEAMWTRFLPHMVRIREVVQSGALGEIRSLTADHRQALSDDPAHRMNALALGGGALLDLGIYPISFACEILGLPTSIHASARFKPTGVDAEVSTLMRHKNGAISATISASDYAGPNTATVVGSKAWLNIASYWYQPTNFEVVDHSGRVLERFEQKVAGRGMQYQAEEMVRLIASGTISSDIMSPADSIDIMAVLDAVRTQISLCYPGEI